jgi:PQQ-like domain
MEMSKLGIGLWLVGLVCATPAGAWRYEQGLGEVRVLTVDGAGDVIGGSVSLHIGDDLTVNKLDGTTGAEIWRVQVDGLASPAGVVALLTDDSGDVIVAGERDLDFFVIKLAGDTGGEVWHYEIPDGTAKSIALSGGDVIAAGRTGSGSSDDDFTVVRLAGPTGIEAWRSDIEGTDTTPSFDGARAVAVDGSGDVVAAGFLTDVDSTDAAIVKLAGGSGAELWRKLIAGREAGAVRVDGAGDVVATGELPSLSTYEIDELVVVKLAGGDGTSLWTYDAGAAGGSTPSLALDSAGDVILGSGLRVVPSALPEFGVIKIASESGAEIWRYVPRGRGYDSAHAVALDSANDVLAVGIASYPRTGGDWAIAKLSGITGEVVWRQRIDGFFGPSYAFPDSAAALGVLPSGDAVAGGSLMNDDPFVGALTILSASALDGAIGPVRGGNLVVQDVAGTPSARRIFVRMKDVALVTPPPASVGDPRTNGATLRLVNPTTLETATLTLPAGTSWRGLGQQAGSRGYRYRDPTGSNGPCKVAVVKPGQIEALCLGSLGTIPFTLDEPTQGSLVVSLQLGTAAAQCARFGGTVTVDQGTANPGPAGAFVAMESAPFAGDCP